MVYSLAVRSNQSLCGQNNILNKPRISRTKKFLLRNCRGICCVCCESDLYSIR